MLGSYTKYHCLVFVVETFPPGLKFVNVLFIEHKYLWMLEEVVFLNSFLSLINIHITDLKQYKKIAPRFGGTTTSKISELNESWNDLDQ